MNKNEFYKRLMTEYSFDADKIRENARKSAKRRNLRPLYIGMAAAAAVCVVTVGSVIAVNLTQDEGVSLVDSGLTQLSASDRLSNALERLEKERGNTESGNFLVTFSSAVSPAEARGVLTAYTDESVPVKQLYLEDGTKISDADKIENIFTGGDDYAITGAAIYCTGDTAARLQNDTAVFLVEAMEDSDLENAAPVNVDEINTQEVTLPEPAETAPAETGTADADPVVIATAEAQQTDETAGTNESTAEPEEMDGTAEPEGTDESEDENDGTEEPSSTEESESTVTAESEPEATTSPAQTAATTQTTAGTSESAPKELSLPAGVTLPADYVESSYESYIGGDSAFFLSENVIYVKNGNTVSLFRYSESSEELICSAELEESKVVWVAEDGGKLMVTGISEYGTRGKTLLVDAEAGTMTDLHTEDCVMSGTLAGIGYNADSKLLVMNIREEGAYYISTMRVSLYGNVEYNDTSYEFDSRIHLLAAKGDTVYYAEGSAIYALDVLSGGTRTVCALSSDYDISKNLALTHAVFTLKDDSATGGTEIFDPETEKLIPLHNEGGSVSFGASRHSFLSGTSCMTISGGKISSTGGISALAPIEYKKSFSRTYEASASGGVVKITASVYNSLNYSTLLTFSEISESAPADLRMAMNGAIGLNNALALEICDEHGLTKAQALIDSLSVYYSESMVERLCSKCGISAYGAFKYTSGGLTAIKASDTALVISENDGASASGVLYIKAGGFGGKTAYRSINVSFVKEDGFWKLNSIL